MSSAPDDSETSLASPDLDLASAEDKQAENTPYVYKPLATPHTIRIFRLHAGTEDETLRGELVCTELEESAVVNRDDKRRLEPYLLRVKIGESAQLEEVEDLASLLQQYDRRTTPTTPQEMYSSFPDRNGISNRWRHGWKPRLWEPYEALSYVWGEPTFSQIIHTPDGFVPIVPNLADALHHLRHQYKSRNLWIDALCIN